MKKSMEWIALVAFAASFSAFADETGHGTPGVDPDSIHDPGKPHVPATSDPSTESTDTWWNDGCADLVTCQGGRYTNTFIHEMAHVYQHQQGVNVVGQGFALQAGRILSFGLYDPYQVTYQPGMAFSAYNIEQQGQLAVMIYRGRVPNIITGGN
jgi:hypothetical protein